MTYIRQREGNSNWGSWVRMDNFGCSTASELASLLGEVVTILTISSLSDINNVTTIGNYFFNSSGQLPTNLPSGINASFYINVEMPVDQRLIQKVVSAVDATSFIRIRSSGGTWSAWKQLTN